MITGCIQGHAAPTSVGVTRLVQDQTPRRLRAVTGALVAASVLCASAGCTGDGGDPTGAASSPLPSRSVESGATLAAKPVPMQVSVAKVVGSRLGREKRQRVEKQLTRVLGRYFDEAYLEGDYPRSDFSDALEAFSAGAARRARADRDLLTNATVGPRVEAVVPRRKQVKLDVLAPRRRVVGLTARVRLVFVEEHAEGSDQRVKVKGRLLMSRARSGKWKVFGYDVSRAATPVAGSEG